MGNLGSFLDSWGKESRCLTQLTQETEGLRIVRELRRKGESDEAGGEHHDFSLEDGTRSRQGCPSVSRTTLSLEAVILSMESRC